MYYLIIDIALPVIRAPSPFPPTLPPPVKVSVLFADIAGFWSQSSSMGRTTTEVVSLMNEMYSVFEALLVRCCRVLPGVAGGVAGCSVQGPAGELLPGVAGPVGIAVAGCCQMLRSL